MSTVSELLIWKKAKKLLDKKPTMQGRELSDTLEAPIMLSRSMVKSYQELFLKKNKRQKELIN